MERVTRQGQSRLPAIEAALGLEVPEDARAEFERPLPDDLAGLAFTAAADEGADPLWATTALRMTSADPVPPGLLAVGFPDERTVACLVCGPTAAPVGSVVRWHLDPVPARHQGRVLDTSLKGFYDTFAVEERHRLTGIEQMSTLAEAYEKRHVVTGKAPRAHDTRTIRLASQNVIIGLAAFRHDLTIDGLGVSLWQATQAPHVVTHEGNRALLAMTLAAAFQFGGTMEVSFADHPQRAVPAGLRQFARVCGVACASDPAAIVPPESRALLRACVPCGPQLEALLEREAGRQALSPERARWLLLSGTWSELELAFMLACAPEAARRVLTGGGDALDRPQRQADIALCRAAVMLQMLRARLEQPDPSVDGHAAVVEDVGGSVDARALAGGAALFSGVERVPWVAGDAPANGGRMVVVARARPGAQDAELACALARRHDATPAVVAPKGAVRFDNADGVLALTAPDHLHDLDTRIESRLLAASVARA